MTRHIARIIAMTALCSLAAVVHVSGPSRAAGDVPQAVDASRKLYMITDSVGLGAQWSIPAALGPEWQVTIDGDPGEFTETLERLYVAPRLTRTPGVFGDYAVVATGYNYPYWDAARFDRSVDSMIATLERAGVKHVFWVTLREIKQQYVSPSGWRQIQPYYWYFPTVNERLEMALARHPDLTLIDFAAVADRSGITYDAIHLNNAGAALYAAITRQAVIDATTALPDGTTTRIAVPGAAGLDAVALNLTTVAPRTSGFLTAFACDGPPPVVSNHNYARSQVVAHAAIVPVNDAGEVCIYNHAASNVIVDVTGTFGSAAGIAGGEPERLVDTRLAGRRQPALEPLVVDVTDGDAAPAPVALSLTAVDAVGPGWMRVAACDTTGTTSTVNMLDAAPIPNVAVVLPGADGTVCVTTSVASHVLVDKFVTFGDSVHVGEPARRDRHPPTEPVHSGIAARCRGDLAAHSGPTGRRRHHHRGAAQPHRHRRPEPRLPVGLPVCRRPAPHLEPELLPRNRRRQLRGRRARSGRHGVRVLAGSGARRRRRHGNRRRRILGRYAEAAARHPHGPPACRLAVVAHSGSVSDGPCRTRR